ncbi:MAG: hypothetical protein ACKPKO_07450, partial [Candidatus Fonsibacter sp.]
MIKDRLKWRPYPKRRGTDADEGGDLYTMDKIREYARDSYTPFYFKKGLVEPWKPANRWEYPPYTAIKDSPESEIMIWLANQVDDIEWAGKTDSVWTTGGALNPFRDMIIDETCIHFFGTRDPTDWDLKTDCHFLAASVFRRLTVSR